MSISPLDLQQLYMQQAHVSKLEHARLASHTLLMQSEDKDINKDSYEKDSTVVKNNEVTETDKVKEQKEDNGKRKNKERFVYYRKKKYKAGAEDEAFDTIVEDDAEKKGKHIDLFG